VISRLRHSTAPSASPKETAKVTSPSSVARSASAIFAVVAALFVVAPAVAAAAPVLEVNVTPQPGTFHRGELN